MYITFERDDKKAKANYTKHKTITVQFTFENMLVETFLSLYMVERGKKKKKKKNSGYIYYVYNF